MSELTDIGVHRSPQDLIDIELTAAGWQSAAAHPNSAVWVSPADGKIYPTPLALQMVRNGVRGDDPFIAEAQQAAREAERQSAPKQRH